MKGDISISLLVYFFISAVTCCEAQNLFRNPGFEDTTLGCPGPNHGFNLVLHWDAVKGSPDYNNCGNKHSAYPAYEPYAGSGFVGCLASWGTTSIAPNHVEGFVQKLAAPLMPCVTYTFSVYAKAINHSNIYRVNCFGSTTKPAELSAYMTHIKDFPEFILLGETEKVSTIGWSKYTFEFQASDTFWYISVIPGYSPLKPGTTFLIFDELSLTTKYEIDTTTINTDTVICAGDSVKLEASDIVGCGTHYWYKDSDPDTIISNDTFLIVSPATTTKYVFFNGLKKDYYMVTVNQYNSDTIVKDTGICPGHSVQLICSDITDSAVWIPDTYLNDPFINNPIATPEEEITYSIELFSYCKEVFYSYNIHILNEESCPKENESIIIPSVFSPNGDELNDQFGFINSKGITSLQYLKVINKFGQIVFETNDIDNSWDGKKNGVSQPVGTYYYHVKGKHNTDGDFEIAGIFELLK